MAGKYGSASVVFLVDGYNLLASKVQTLRHKISADQEPSHGLGDSWEESTPTGMRKIELAQDGAFFDDDSNRIHVQLSAVPGSDTPQSVAKVSCVGFSGNVAGRLFYGIVGAFVATYEALATVGKLHKANASYATSGAVENGVVLHALGAETTDPGNTEGALSVDHSTEPGTRQVPITSSSVASPSLITCPCNHGLTTGDSVLIAGHSGSTPTINGERVVTVVSPTTFTIPVNVTVGGTGGTFVPCKTVSGGAGYLQVTDVTLGGYTNVLVKVRDSADDITYGDLLSFTAVTARSAERVAVAGDVERHLAIGWDFVGSGTGQSITFFAGFARN